MMKSNGFWISALFFLSFSLLSSCKKEDDIIDDNPGETIVVDSNITSNTTWTRDQDYLLKGFVHVTAGNILTIEAGTIIKGDKDTKATLIIDRDAKIMANGSATEPIIFTSAKAKGLRSYGDWGALIICGNAAVNLPGGVGEVEGGTAAQFGGGMEPNNDDNSGILKYVRLEFTGIPYNENQEINGLTLAGVGSGTTIDYIQVSYSGDDAIEIFGGAANVKHFISFRAWDDDFDFDNGWTGKGQFLVSLREPNSADQSGSNGIESDNDGAGTDALPYTSPVISNLSIFGPMATASTSLNAQFKRAAHIRRNCKTSIYNSVFSGFPTGLLLDGSGCEANANAGELQFMNNIIAGCTTPLSVAGGSTFDINAWVGDVANANTIFTHTSELMVTDGFNLYDPNFIPLDGSPLLHSASFDHSRLSGMEEVSYRGAFGTTDWTSGWANWDPNDTDY